jgi:hypothetical protein
MATGTLGTAATTSLISINGWNPATAIADVAAIAAHILKQGNPAHPIEPGAFSPSGQLFLPGGRGIIKLKPGDYIAYDHFGWPIVVSSESIADASSSWAHS